MADTTWPSLLNRLHNVKDARSWRDFVERYWRLVYSFARRCGLSPADSEDVLQDVLAEVFQALPTFAYDRSKGTFRAYLRTITQRKIVDHLRTSQKLASRTGAGHERGNGRRTLEDPTDRAAEEAWARDWRRNIVLSCLDQVRVEVEPKTYQAFQLYALEEWPVKEVAEFLKMSTSSVYTAKSRILQRLRGHLENEFGEDELQCLKG